MLEYRNSYGVVLLFIFFVYLFMALLRIRNVLIVFVIRYLYCRNERPYMNLFFYEL